MSYGTLMARVYTSRALLPVQYAGVAVTIARENGRELAGFRLTDENGLTEKIQIDTPDTGLSTQPGTASPYAVCNVKVAHPSYGTVEVDNVQIFPGVLTIQDILLIPLEEYPSLYREREKFNVTGQNL